jgi:serine/threonine-protein kinase
MSQRERLGKYEIVEVLGRGAMGIVFKGFDPGIDRTVAIKTIRKELIEDDDRAGMALARFRNEARAAGRLSHPGIVAVYDYGESDAVSYIAMEYVQGNSLREYFNRGARFGEADIVSIMAQLLEALQHAHDAGVWHRDIKPANLIIMANGRLKIADFGIARIEASQLTQTGVVMGSPGYMAPEQYSGGTIDWRADLFACGVVMHQLLTGTRLYTGSAEQVAYRICHQEPPAPSAVDPGKGWERYDALLAQALAKNPDQRFASAAAFREAVLRAYAAPVSAAVSEETIIAAQTMPAGVFEPSNPSARTGDPSVSPVRQTLPPSAPASADLTPAGTRRRWPIWAGGALAVVLGAVLGGWWVGHKPASVASEQARQPSAALPEIPPKTQTPIPSVKAISETIPRAAADATPQPPKVMPPPKRTPRVDATAPATVASTERRTERRTPRTQSAPKPAPPRQAAPVAPVPAPEPTSSPAPAPEPVAAASASPPVPAATAEASPPPPPPPSIWRDQGITMKVASKLQFNRRLWSAGILVDTNQGIVTLSGTVSSKALAEEAERIAAAVYGVHGVKNEIQVTP